MASLWDSSTSTAPAPGTSRLSEKYCEYFNSKSLYHGCNGLSGLPKHRSDFWWKILLTRFSTKYLPLVSSLKLLTASSTARSRSSRTLFVPLRRTIVESRLVSRWKDTIRVSPISSTLKFIIIHKYRGIYRSEVAFFTIIYQKWMTTLLAEISSKGFSLEPVLFFFLETKHVQHNLPVKNNGQKSA